MVLLIDDMWNATDNFETVQGKSEYKFISSKYVAFA